MNSSNSCGTLESTFLNVAAYKFVALADIPARRRTLWQAAHDHRLRGTVLLSPEGINLFLAGPEDGIRCFLELLRSDTAFADLTVKKSWTDFQPFRRLLVKQKKEIIAFGVESVHPERATSPKISPEQLKQWLDEGRPITLLDTRNDYEVELGTFRNAVDLNIRHFRKFPEAVEALPPEAKDRPMVMFCTGGIRCEKAGAYVEQIGFREVYQLDGGILNYFERCGDAHYEGDCFVFDHRVAVTPSLAPSGARLCYACQAALTAEDLASDKYKTGVSCPNCYTSPEEQTTRLLAARNGKLAELASDPPGCRPYENRQPMFVAKRFAGQNIVDWLADAYRTRTREEWTAAIRSGLIATGAHYATAQDLVDETHRVREGQAFALVQSGFVEPWVEGNIRILFEDEWMVVVDKPAPLPVHASGRYYRNTLEHFLDQVYRPEKLFLAHRLDADTTGLVVLSRRHAVAHKLQSQFSEQRVEKTYLARVFGRPAAEAFSSSSPIGRDKLQAGTRLLDESGQSAHTDFRVRQYFEDETTLIEARPRTGRTHQIRLQLAGLGFPIVGDRLYAKQDALQPATPATGKPLLCLHAWKLGFQHPRESRGVEFEATPPAWAGCPFLD